MACQWHFVSGSPLTVAGAATNEDFSLSCSLFTFRNARKEPSQDCYPMGGGGSQWARMRPGAPYRAGMAFR